MKTMILALLIGLVSATEASAGIPSCESLNLRKVPVGTKCVTSKGAVYQRVARAYFGEAWQGPDGVTWSDSFGRTTDYQVSHDRCLSIGARLPTVDDFNRGHVSGFLEVLPKMKTLDNPWSDLFGGDHYWSSTPKTDFDPPSKEPYVYAYPFFSEAAATVDFGWAPYYAKNISLRCVAP